MDIIEKLKANPGGAAVAAATAVAALGLGWVLCTQPLGMGSAAPGSASGSGGSSPAAMGSSRAPGQDGSAALEALAGAVADDAAGTPAAPDQGSAAQGDEAAAQVSTGAATASGDPGTPQGNTARPDAPSPGGSGTQAPAAKPQEPAAKPSEGPSEKPAPGKPQHDHSWQAVYRDEPVYGQQWVPNWVDVFKYRQERYVCRQCGYVAYSGGELDKHFMDSYVSGGNCGTYLDDSYDVYEKEDHGSYQQVQTDTKKVLDHYVCSCGAVK